MGVSPPMVTIGRDPDATIPLSEPSVSWHHARIEVEADRHVLIDGGSSNGTFVNGLRVQRSLLEPGDLVQIGAAALLYDGTRLTRVPASSGGVDLEVRQLAVQLGGHTILNDVSATIARNEFVAIIGSSGSGKSTLLRAMTGVIPSASGEVLYNGFNIDDSLDAFRPLMGYVPQRDIVHHLLTVRRALDYAARLRLPTDWTAAARTERIEEVLGEVDLLHRIDYQIGSLSGGQIKRVSVALELLGNPRVLYLDEPTSGLDPGLDKRLMGLFRTLADGNRTVVVVTHATAHLDMCDRVVMLAPGGRVAYEGRPSALPRHFDVDSYADAFAAVETQVEQERLQTPNPTRQAPIRRDTRHQAPWPRRRVGFARSFRVMTSRCFELALRDRRNLAIMLAQAPVIGLILVAVATDNAFSDYDVLFPQAQTVAFSLALVAIWFGLINAIREIVKERPIVDRERLAGLRGDAYVVARAMPLVALTAVQCAVLVLLITPRTGWAPQGLVSASALDAFVSLLLVGLVSIAVAFVVSSLAANEDQAASAIPFLLIPQFLLAGVVFSLGEATTFISRFMIGRWGAEALGGSVTICDHAPNPGNCDQMADLTYPTTASELLQIWALLGLVAILLFALTALILERQRARV